MNHRLTFASAFAAVLAAAFQFAAGDVRAQDARSASAPGHPLGQHPAVLVQRQPQAIDPNTFIVAHPAGLALIAAPTPTYAHPAVAVARMGRAAAELDRLMAEPPVASAWLRRRDAATTAALSVGTAQP